MLEFMKQYFPKLLAFIVAILIFLQILPPDYDPFAGDNTTSISEVTEDPTSETEEPSSEDPTNPTDPDDPLNWSVAKIVDYYKTAAAKTEANGCRSHQEMELVSLTGAPSYLSGTVEKAINSNSNDFDGLTGGYENLCENDIQFAIAREYEGKIIMTLIPKDQTDGVNGREGEGTVGHLVYVVDGVEQVLGKTGVSGSFPEGSAKLDYKHAYANNIIIDKSTGLIESGEWGYNVHVYLNGCKVAGITLKNINAVIKYTVTLI